MNRPFLKLLAALAVALGACAGSQPAVRIADGDGKAGERAAPAAPEISTRAKLLFEDAVKSYDAQNKAGAWDYPALEKKFQAALDADGALAEAEYNLGVLAERQGKIDEAQSRYRSALHKKPSLRQAAENLAVLLQNQGDVGGAVKMYQQTLASHPDDGGSRARLAEIYRQQNDHERAMALAREALIREPNTLTAYKVMMRSYLDRKQLSMAKLVALRATKLDAEDPELFHAMGLILLEEGERAQAVAQFKLAVQSRPDYLPARVALARLALESEDYADAEEHLRRLLQANARDAQVHLNLGVAYKGLGQFDKALQSYEEAEKLDPELAAVHFNRGVILHRHKDAPEKAVEQYKKYLAMSAGGAGLHADAPVFALLKEAEAIVQAKEDAIRAEAEAKRMEEELKRQEAAQKAEEERLKKLEAEEKGANAAPAAAEAKKADAQAGKTEPAAAQKPEQKPPARASKKAKAKRASDEPADGL